MRSCHCLTNHKVSLLNEEYTLENSNILAKDLRSVYLSIYLSIYLSKYCFVCLKSCHDENELGQILDSGSKHSPHFEKEMFI